MMLWNMFQTFYRLPLSSCSLSVVKWSRNGEYYGGTFSALVHGAEMLTEMHAPAWWTWTGYPFCRSHARLGQSSDESC